MAWFHLEDTFTEHPKISDLAEVLKIDLLLAQAHMINLWCWVLRFAPDGDLRSFKVGAIERAAKWRGEAGALLRTLCEVGLIDKGEEGYIVHGWYERAGSYRNAERARASRSRKRSLPSRDGHATVRNSHKTVTPESRREERRGEEKEKRREEPPQSPPVGGVSAAPKGKSKNTEAIAEVYEHWRSYHPRAPARLKAVSPDARKIRQRLDDGATVELLKAAIDGCHRTPHNQGQNERGTKYLGLNVIMRDTSQVTRFAEAAEGPPPRASPQVPPGHQIPRPPLKEATEPEWMKLKRERDAERARKEPGHGHR